MVRLAGGARAVATSRADRLKQRRGASRNRSRGDLVGLVAAERAPRSYHRVGAVARTVSGTRGASLMPFSSSGVVAAMVRAALVLMKRPRGPAWGHGPSGASSCHGARVA